MHTSIERVLLSRNDISSRVAALGYNIMTYYSRYSEPLLLLGVLKGAAPFAAQLAQAIDLPLEIDYLRASSYQGTESSGTVLIEGLQKASLSGYHVLIVEDIVDTGRTLARLTERLGELSPESMRVCALLDKPERRVVPAAVHYLGFTIPDAFVVGYGLDYNERYRNLPYIGVLKEECYAL